MADEKSLVPYGDRDRFMVTPPAEGQTGMDAALLARSKYVRSLNADKRTGRTITFELAMAAVEGSMGMLNVIAERLDISRRSLSRLREEWPELEAAITDEREFMLDWAESNVYRAVMEGNLKVSMFHLKTMGARRGWSEKQIVEGNPNRPIEHHHTWEGGLSHVLSKLHEAGLELSDVVDGDVIEVKELPERGTG
jgi:hypothetical protein